MGNHCCNASPSSSLFFGHSERGAGPSERADGLLIPFPQRNCPFSWCRSSSKSPQQPSSAHLNGRYLRIQMERARLRGHTLKSVQNLAVRAVSVVWLAAGHVSCNCRLSTSTSLLEELWTACSFWQLKTLQNMSRCLPRCDSLVSCMAKRAYLISAYLLAHLAASSKTEYIKPIFTE